MKVPQSVIEQLEFDKILEFLRNYCIGDTARKHLSEIRFVTDRKLLLSELNGVADWLQMSADGNVVTFQPYEDISEELFLLSKKGYVLESESVLKILRVLTNYCDFYRLIKEHSKEYKWLYEKGYLEDFDEAPIKEIERVFDSSGQIRSNASPELAKIFKRIEQTQKELDNQFNELVQKYKSRNILSDSAESWRNGRRVLVLPVENKRKVEGVIHDQSATGKTVFIEPQDVISSNNNLFSLDNEKRAEVYRILRDLSAKLGDSREMIGLTLKKLSLLDVIQAKARLSSDVDGVLPGLGEGPLLQVKKLAHPLLVIAEKKGGHKVIPFDLTLKSNNRILLISGPNAGGKSVTLKALGLVHLMLYAGILVPVDPQSVFGQFDKIFTDIGDHQDIDEGLSTYSSHLKNLNQIIKSCDQNSLVLLDEIGSGTDPKLGGAIAEGMLRAMMSKKVFGIVTTHYSDLKLFAFKNKGIVNGAMLFDKEKLTPSYQLKVGKPGSSYAFEVAKKIGLDKKVIRYAKQKVGKKENQVEDLLVNLQEDRVRLEKKIDQLDRDKLELDKLIKTYEKLSSEFEVKRKKLQIRSKEVEFKRANDEHIELQKLINKLDKEKNLEEARRLKDSARKRREEEGQQIVSIKKKIFEKEANGVIKEGSTVRLLDGELSGEVLSVKGKKAEVLFGLVKMTVPLEDLVNTSRQIEINRSKAINVKGVAFKNNFSPKLDIRGYKFEDASRTLEEFFDQALLSNANTLEVVHGKGSGALRKLVKEKIKDFAGLEFGWHPADEMGGDGVTVIRL